jgi:hypothetical protein
VIKARTPQIYNDYLNKFISKIRIIRQNLVQKAVLIPERGALTLRSTEAIVTAQDLEQKFRRFRE